ncbi:MAG: SDR family oxidoreductase [Anaerolineales bacterium]|nr:SDR family oxidoreductase [Anaerolineales bacterium]
MKDKVAIITGASSGIGEAIARLFVKKGLTVALIARRSENLALIVNDLKRQGGNAVSYSCDISDMRQIKDTFSKIAEDFNIVHFLINNAGISSNVSMTVINPEPLLKDYSVNAIGTYACSASAYPLMPSGGAIVNIASIWGRLGSPSSSLGYAASKAAIINITKSLAMYLARHNIRVNCIAPGAVYPTEMSIAWDETKRTEISAATLLGRLGSPEEIAEVAYFFISDSSSFVTGQTLDVNGGRWMS